MVSHDERVAVGRRVATCAVFAVTCVLSISASARSACSSDESVSVPRSEISGLIGQDVMISFKWSKPTSVLEALTLVGSLVRVDKEILVVDVEKSVRSKEQERVVDALERHGRITRDPDGRLVYVRRTGIANLWRHPRI